MFKSRIQMDMQQLVIFGDFVSALNKANDLDECFQKFTYAVEQLGFSGVVYTSIPIDLKLIDNNKPVFLHSSGFNAQYLKHYDDENFAKDDFTIKKISSGHLKPLVWWHEQSKGSLHSAEQQVIQVARDDYGLTNGISIPTLSNSSHLAGASIVSEEKDLSFNLLLEERFETLRLIVQHFHTHIHKVPKYNKIFYLPLIGRLTMQQKQVLKHVTTGKPLKQINPDYNIGESRAGNVQSELIKKFGTSNINKLTYILGVHGILEML